MKIKSYRKQLWPGPNGKNNNKKLFVLTSIPTGIILASMNSGLVPIHSIQHWGAARKPEAASH